MKGINTISTARLLQGMKYVLVLCLIVFVLPIHSQEEHVIEIKGNVFGGARMADVKSTHVTVYGGKVYNVYGGNDITGKVQEGSRLDIYSSIIEDVFGGGNGSYVYTDVAANKEVPKYQDYYYEPGEDSYESLNAFRPNLAKTYVHVAGTEENPTFIGGSIYCGGNSCTLRAGSDDPRVTTHLQIGSYVIADSVFFGNNGANMITADFMEQYADDAVSSLDLTDSLNFAKYMQGAEMSVRPSLGFDEGYEEYSTKIGSFYLGGNVGSLSVAGMYSVTLDEPIVIYNKLVGGCNDANVPKGTYNAFYQGGVISETRPVKIKFNIAGVKLEPHKLTYDPGTHTFSLEEWRKDEAGLLVGANIYGGCFKSGYINGGVEINIKDDAISNRVFPACGVPLSDMQQAPLVSALSVYGGGYGSNTEIWGDVVINITENAGILNVYGGGEQGVVGKMEYDTNGNHTGRVLQAYNTTVNLDANLLDDNKLNASRLYAGGFEGVVTGNTTLNLNQGRIYRGFGGSCNADILGATTTIIGQSSRPYVTGNVYGGNDFGGQIQGTLKHHLNDENLQYQDIRSNTYVEYLSGHIDGNIFGGPCGDYDYSGYVGKYSSKPTLLTALGKGDCDYAPNTFVNIASTSTSPEDVVTNIFGAGQGKSGKMGAADINTSYVLLHAADASVRENDLATNIYGAGDCSLTHDALVDAYSVVTKRIFGGCQGSVYTDVFNADGSSKAGIDANLSYMGETSTVNLWTGMDKKSTDVYGAGAYSGTKHSVVNLYGGEANNIYGASLDQGVTYLAQVNVPDTSTAKVNAIFGGAKGNSNTYNCDAYVSYINFNSPKATVEQAIYGGNHDNRFTRDAYIHINQPVQNKKGKLVNVFGAGYGSNTVAGRSHIFMEKGAKALNVYGGGRDGSVLIAPSLQHFINTYDVSGSEDIYKERTDPKGFLDFAEEKADLFTSLGIVNNYRTSTDPSTSVHLLDSSYVEENVYGGGLGSTATIAGTTGVMLEGGTVAGDLYGGGKGGHVMDTYRLRNFVAGTYVKLIGGTARNVYGGGLDGNVGMKGTVGQDYFARTHVVMGVKDQQNSTYKNGDATVERSIYGGGQRGAVIGMTNLYIHNGHVGYKYYAKEGEEATYHENIELVAGSGDELLKENGNAFGGGYGEGATVDTTNVILYGGVIRNSLYGGGEIASVGRAEMEEKGYLNSERSIISIERPGATNVTMYRGLVCRDVFGGGRGYSYDLTGNEVIGDSIFTDGYVFGHTGVNIYGGVVGTEDNVDDGYGNVFGGGNIGYVYSIEGSKSEEDGYYYDYRGNLTEDCTVIISPYAQVKDSDGISITNGGTYAYGEYVPTEDLNKLKNKAADRAQWDKLDVSGILIRNAVFAGGNVSTGSDKVFANVKTVFGNVTATLYDVYHRDLITVGTEHIGGLYGDGNLTFVDGYRELNITNYGTDYYGMHDRISLDEYSRLTDRERAYFSIEYECAQRVKIDGKWYEQGNRITEDVYSEFPEEYQTETYWTKAGFCSIYAGRLLNTLQRADFVGVFGSRMVLQGATDRVTDEVDYTQYTINRVGEISLNKQLSQAGDTEEESKSHGSYFGIYNIVNYLGHLTSDVKFGDVRYTDNSDASYRGDNYGTKTYLEWKRENVTNRKRNNGSSHNKVALASGVYLELTTEASTKTNKVYGDITGIIELDLINVMTGLGGGYVYARNEHGEPTYHPERTNVILSRYNTNAVTYKKYSYNSNYQNYQTSGNFVHNTKRIIDDCYPNNGSYDDGYVASPAHYWYVKGDIYVYDQTISAYTGASTAYSKEINIPLNITAASHGKMKLLNVQTSKFAYYQDQKTLEPIGELGVIAGNKTYYRGDPITYWDYMQLTDNEQKMFLDSVYVSVAACSTLSSGNPASTSYPSGTVMTVSDYKSFAAKNATLHHTERDEDVPVSDVFRLSNNMSFDNGYVLSLFMNNPKDWDQWYSIIKGDSETDRKSTRQYNALSKDDKELYLEGPSFATDESGVYGQRLYGIGDIITEEVYKNYNDIPEAWKPTENQATMERAYVAKSEVIYQYLGHESHVYPGVAISSTEYNALSTDAKACFAEAWTCTRTLDAGNNQFVFYTDLVDADSIAKLKQMYAAFYGVSADAASKVVDSHFSKAYYCLAAGEYGGRYYSTGENYSSLESWCALSAADREHFSFNYDAFNLLVDPQYQGNTALYGSPYDLTKPVDYTAKYTGNTDLQYHDKAGTLHTIAVGSADLEREDYELIPNEEAYYTPVLVDPTDAEGEDYYIVKTDFVRGDVPYAAGQIVSETMYNSLDSDQKNKVTYVRFVNTTEERQLYYYCHETYEVGALGEGMPFEDRDGVAYEVGDTVEAGVVITSDEYNDHIPNFQKSFLIKGKEPTETATLYVSRESDIYDLSSDRIITVIYQYSYNESDESGIHIEPINELHVVNIRVQFESGVPSIGQLLPPSTVLPGSTVGLKQPETSKGAYEILGGGWEIFTNKSDGENHRNGVPYINNATPMYWYQDGYYVAYYTKTYLGKTYSNAVQFSVANYHDLDAVMKDKDHHLYIDHPDVKRNSKIYIDNRDCTSDATKSKLDLLYDFHQLSLIEAPADTNDTYRIPDGIFEGHAVLNQEMVHSCENLDFFLSSDVSPKKYTTWNPIGATSCFEGVVHGDGHTVSGLTHSLFANLCGDVYNLGVTGSFTGAGIADAGTGYVENCWIKTTGEPDGSLYAVFGNPQRDSGTQIVNCYYPSTNNYKKTTCARGNATEKSLYAFNNGEVAYNLNGFYLKKRYKDHVGGNPELSGNMSYVTDRYDNIDFVYADGKIPVTTDIRFSTDDGLYHPLWPDDYLFFGQSLTYGYDEIAYQNTPSCINKTENGQLAHEEESNRVYRAPAYFRSSALDVAYFNSNAVFAMTTSDKSADIYPRMMTAIDFTGYGDNSYTREDEAGFFYRPLLDDDGLMRYRKFGITPNLLVYIPEVSVNQKTNQVLSKYFLTEPVYDTNSHDDAGSTNVATIDASVIRGHAVFRNEDAFEGRTDHFLVDKNDFNAPISYSFVNNKRMWYQRKPDTYVDINKGWESISIPFTAEMVATNEKGEITHFYGDSKVGHEYWLRTYRDISAVDEEDKATALFTRPDAMAGYNKEYANTFLWDKYYSYNSYDDANGDDYPDNDKDKAYYRYSTPRVYEDYPLLQNAVPYIIGFPGARYYEFDLSGTFEAQNTASPAPTKLSRQTISFVSQPNIEIQVSDTELADGKITHNGYTFWPNYLNNVVKADGYVLNADGNSYVKTTEEQTEKERTVLPFRSYFAASGAADNGVKRARRIEFSNDISSLFGDDEDNGDSGLYIRALSHRVLVTSTLRHETRVQIRNVAGQVTSEFSIAPGETVEQPIYHAGVYVVNSTDGTVHGRKLLVK